MELTEQKKLFEELYNGFSSKVFRLCLAYTNDENLSNDLMQDCFLKVWQNLPKFRGESSHATWIYRIAANTCLTFLKKGKREERAIVSVDVADDVIEKHTIEEQVVLLYHCIAKLNDADKLIITLILENVPQKDIAATLGIRENTINVKVHRIKKELTRLFKNHERV